MDRGKPPQETGDGPDITRLLASWAGGDHDAAEQLVPLVYRQLKSIARRHLAHERPGHTLQPTALVHEAFLRLSEQQDVDWKSRQHFFGVASELVRRILVDYARSRNAAKRGSGGVKLTLDQLDEIAGPRREADLIQLDDALGELEKLDRQQARIVELRFFGGLSIEETARVVGVHPSTVKREWILAKAFLRRQLAPADAPPPSEPSEPSS